MKYWRLYSNSLKFLYTIFSKSEILIAFNLELQNMKSVGHHYEKDKILLKRGGLKI